MAAFSSLICFLQFTTRGTASIVRPFLTAHVIAPVTIVVVAVVEVYVVVGDDVSVVVVSVVVGVEVSVVVVGTVAVVEAVEVCVVVSTSFFAKLKSLPLVIEPFVVPRSLRP
jgi:hypothetical protein